VKYRKTEYSKGGMEKSNVQIFIPVVLMLLLTPDNYYWLFIIKRKEKKE